MLFSKQRFSSFAGRRTPPQSSRRQLGKSFYDGEYIFRRGEPNNTLYMIQQGEVLLYCGRCGESSRTLVLRQGDMLGITGLVGHQTRVSSARSQGPSRLLSLDKKRLIMQMHLDPSLSFKVLTSAIHRIRLLEYGVEH
ncbi:cyclic nucleotide-binding domain-containing protein [Magnetococcales bacterium HHB-1]